MKASILRKRRIAKEVRREVVFGLKMQGLSGRTIVVHLKELYGVTVSHATVATDWKAALAEHRRVNEEEFQELFDLTNARHERIIKAWWIKAIVGNAQAADIVGRHLKALRELNGLDRAIWGQDSSSKLESNDEELDYSRLSDQELDRLEELVEKARVVPPP